MLSRSLNDSYMLERVILRRLLEHLKVNGLFPSVQSAYRKCHSTETAMARVLSDILMALDRGDVAALALLDLSAAFDTVDHCILLRHLRESYGISGAALTWISSSVPDRSSAVCLLCRNAVSAGVHQVWGAAGLRPRAPAFLCCTPPISPR